MSIKNGIICFINQLSNDFNVSNYVNHWKYWFITKIKDGRPSKPEEKEIIGETIQAEEKENWRFKRFI